jgi:hypothetical protein
MRIHCYDLRFDVLMPVTVKILSSETCRWLHSFGVASCFHLQCRRTFYRSILHIPEGNNLHSCNCSVLILEQYFLGSLRRNNTDTKVAVCNEHILLVTFVPNSYANFHPSFHKCTRSDHHIPKLVNSLHSSVFTLTSLLRCKIN